MATSKGVSRQTWYALAKSHDDFANDIRWIANLSIQSYQARLRGLAEPIEIHPDVPHHIAISRAKAEGKAPESLESDAAAFELHILLEQLLMLHKHQNELSDIGLKLAKEVKRGRPRSAPLPIHEGISPRNKLAALLLESSPAKAEPKRRGRKPPEGIEVNSDLLLKLAANREEFEFKSEKALMRDFARYWLEKQGKHRSDSRVEKIATYLQRLLSETRASIRKGSDISMK